MNLLTFGSASAAVARGGLVRVAGQGHATAHLAVHLHGNLDHVVDGERLVELGPGLRWRSTAGWPSTSHSSSARCGANGERHSTSFSTASRGGCSMPFRWLTRIIIALIAVLSDSASMSRPTFCTVRCTSLAVSGSSAAVAQRPTRDRVRAVQEATHALNAARLPGLGLLERAHEHLVQAQAVGAELLDDHVRAHEVAARFGHLLGDTEQPHAELAMHRLAFADLDLGLFGPAHLHLLAGRRQPQLAVRVRRDARARRPAARAATSPPSLSTA